MTTITENNNSLQNEEKEAKVQELREIISNAQETISSATQLLSAIQGTTPSEMPINQTEQNEDDENAIYGYFDGQIMVGDDGRQYPVPANYASKSKLVEGDKLKLNITPDNRFVYKQIGPVPRNYLIGVVKKDVKGNFTIQTPEKEYQVLLAAATYFKIEDGDEVTLIVPQGKTTIWGAIENVLQKSTISPDINSLNIAPTINTSTPDKGLEDPSTKSENTDQLNNTDSVASEPLTEKPDYSSEDDKDYDITEDLSAIEKLELELEKEREDAKKISKNNNTETPTNIDPTHDKSNDTWTSDIDKLREEAGIAVGQ